MRSVRSRFRRSRNADINIAPLLDMVFILLIFFMVTSHFTRETSVEISKPSVQNAEPLSGSPVVVEITRSGMVLLDEYPVSLSVLESSLRRTGLGADKSVLIIADKEVSTDMLLAVHDRCSVVGAEHISVATTKKR